MDTVISLYVLFLAVAGCTASEPSCRDIDPAACPVIAQQNPNLCDDPNLSSLACPRFCKKCPLLCYDCVLSTDKGNQNCNQTKECSSGEQCMIRHLQSTADGHGEVLMQCASIQVCDLTGTFGIIGKRDVSIHCCKEDLCNNNEKTTTASTTTTSTTTTTTSTTIRTTPIPTTITRRPTTKTTTALPSCNKDITILIEDTARRSHGDTYKITSLLNSMFGKLTIGPQYNKVALALFDDNLHLKWKFDSPIASDKSILLRSISRLSFSYSDNDIDYDDIRDFLDNFSNHAFSKDRHGTDNVVIIFAENDTKRLEFRGEHYGFDKIIYVSLLRSAYTGSFHNIAQVPSHVFTVYSYDELQAIQLKLLSALCDNYHLQ